MSHINTVASVYYREAVQTTESLEPPAVGFVKPGDYKGASSSTAIIKQNNTIIQLLVQIANQLDNVERRVQALEGRKPGDLTSDLVEKLEKLSVGPEATPSRRKEGNGLLRVFKDPKAILAEVQAREEARWLRPVQPQPVMKIKSDNTEGAVGQPTI